MDTATIKVNEEAQIRQLVDEWVNALRSKDIDGMLSNYSPDILVFGITPQLQYRGADSIGKNGRRCSMLSKDQSEVNEYN